MLSTTSWWHVCKLHIQKPNSHHSPQEHNHDTTTQETTLQVLKPHGKAANKRRRICTQNIYPVVISHYYLGSLFVGFTITWGTPHAPDICAAHVHETLVINEVRPLAISTICSTTCFNVCLRHFHERIHEAPASLHLQHVRTT